MTELMIVSGGQTGVDQGALDAAILLGVPHGGVCPQGRRSEAGPIPARYLLREHSSPDYLPRTEMNVVRSDATLILFRDLSKSRGTKRTIELCMQHRRPYLLQHVDCPPVCTEFLRVHNVRTLNVAGHRESHFPGIQEATKVFVVLMIEELRLATPYGSTL